MRCMVVGLGELGWRTAQILAHSPAVDEVLTVDVREERRGRAFVVDYGARLLGLRASVRFSKGDVLGGRDLGELLSAFRPDVVINTASLQAWHVIRELPEHIWREIHSAGLGIWLPAHLAPAKAVMEQVRACVPRATTINMAFPDAVNVVLSRIGLGPDLGAGNIDELAVPLREKIARRYGCADEDVMVWMVGHHWVNAAVLELGETRELPLLVRATVGGRDVSGELDVPALLAEIAAECPPGVEDTWFIAASAVHKALAIRGGEPVQTHATGVLGLPGGYPVTLQDGQVELNLPEGVDLRLALEVNLDGQRRDGVAEIAPSGDVLLTDQAKEIMQDVLGWRYERYAVEHVDELAREITARYREFARKVRDGLLHGSSRVSRVRASRGRPMRRG